MLTLTTSSNTPSGTYTIPITGTSGSLSHTASLALTVSASGTSLPAPWTNQDIGTPRTGTGSIYNNGTFTVSGLGCCPANSSFDNFQFAYQTLGGDGTIVARLSGEVNALLTSGAGLMIRDSLTASSANVFIGLAANLFTFQYRSATAGVTSTSSGGAGNAPEWFKLVRAGNTFSGYVSADGNNWVQIGTTQAIPMAATVYVGFALTSGSTNALTVASFDNVVITTTTTPDFYMNTVPPSVTVQSGGGVGYTKAFVNSLNGFNGTVNLSVSVSGLPTGASSSLSSSAVTGSGTSTLTITTTSSTPAGSYPVTITGTSGSLTRRASLTLSITNTRSNLPAQWSNEDLATPGSGMGTNYTNGTFTVIGGCCLGPYTDNVQLAYQTLIGDGTLIARLTNVVNPAGYVGLMLRESLAPEAKTVEMHLSNGSLGYQRRDPALSGLGGWADPSVSLPFWMKLVRSGTTVTGYYSMDGSNWSALGYAVTISMTDPVYIGMFAASNSAGTNTTATFDNVFVVDSTSTTPDFYLSPASDAPTTIAAGGSVGYPKVYVSAVNGFSGTVSLTVSGLPTGATGSFSPASVAGSGTSLLTITTSSSTPAGAYPLTITGTSGSLTHTASLTFTVTNQTSNLPSPWVHQDTQSGGTGTGSGYSNGTFTVTGSCCLGVVSDNVQFAYQLMTGDGALIARLTNVVNPAGYVGLMLRESLAPEAKTVEMHLSNGSLGYQRRDPTLSGLGGWGGPSVSLPFWMKLVRSANNFSGYISMDGSNWSQVAYTVTISMTDPVYIGMYAASNSTGTNTTASFDNIFVVDSTNTTPDFYLGTVPTSSTSIAAGGSVGYPKVYVNPVNGFNGSVSLSVSGLPTGATGSFSPGSLTGSGASLLTITTTSSTPSGSYSLTITGTSGSLTHRASLTLTVTTTTSSLPTSWSNQDSGTPGTGTGSSYSGGIFTVTGEGCCLGTNPTTDNLQLAYQPLSGNTTIIARVTSVSTSTGFAGLMIRETLSPESRAAEVHLNTSSGFASRNAPFANLGGWAGPSLTLPYWLKLVRSGNNFSAYISMDGSTWTQGGGTTAVSMTDPVYVGLLAISNSSSTTSTAIFDHVTITQP
jgi:hypothetical protein